jgi:homoserine kinase
VLAIAFSSPASSAGFVPGFDGLSMDLLPNRANSNITIKSQLPLDTRRSRKTFFVYEPKA